MLLPDVNVWLALTFDSHVHHPIAKAWFDGLTNDVAYFCRTTQQGMLRLASNPKAFGTHALNLGQAWDQYDRLRSDPCVDYLDEPFDLEAHWRGFTQRPLFNPHVWTDACLAAFAVTGQLELVSFDKAIAQFPGLRCSILA